MTSGSNLRGSLDSSGAAGPQGFRSPAASGAGARSQASGTGRFWGPPGPSGSSFGPRGSASGVRTFGPYSLLRELGRGSNGVVFLAAREGLPRCALKVPKEELGEDEEALRRFRLEAAVAFKLSHPGVIRVLDAGSVNGHSYLAMELCEGETLAQRLVRGPLPPDQAHRLLLELGAAVAHAHEQGVIHRDLKPSNVIIEEATGRPRLTDFGLTRDRSLARSLTRSGDVLGTPAYMSPEQFRGQKDVDERVDVWGLGAILYECLTGRRPFPATNVTELAMQVLEEPLRAPSAFATVPPALEVICKKALAKDREERYPSAVEMVQALQVAGETWTRASRSSARIPAALRGGRAPAPADRRRRTTLLLAAALVVLGGLGGAAIAWSALPARRAREALAGVRAMVDGDADAATALAVLELAEASARELGQPDLLAEAEDLRGAVRLLSRADQLLSEGDDAERGELVAGLRERARGAGDRWARLAELLETRVALGRLSDELDQGQPVAELEARLAALPGLDDPRLRRLRQRLQARLETLRLLDEARELATRSWRDRSRVLETFARGIERAQSEPAVLDQLRLERARFYMRRGMLDESIQECGALLERPGRTGGEAGLVLANCLVWQGWFAESYVLTERVIGRDRDDTVARLKGLARQRSWSRAAEEGERFARKALELDPRDVEAAMLAAQCAVTRSPDRGLAELQELTRRAPSDTGVWIAYMLALDVAGRAEESDVAAQKAVDLVLPSPAGFVWLTRGLLRIMRGLSGNPLTLKGAEEDLQRCERLEPQNIRPRLYRATLAAMDGGLQALMGGDMRAVQPLLDLYDEFPRETTRFVDNLPDARIQQGFRMLLRGRRR